MAIRYLNDNSSPAQTCTAPSIDIDLDAFRAVFNASPQGIMVHRQHKPLYVNNAWAAIHGYEIDEIMAMETVTDLLSPEDKERLVTYNQDRLAAHPAPTRYHYQIVQKSGRLLWVEVFVQVLDWSGEPAVQCTMIDARPRDNAVAERLRRAEHANERFLKALEEFSEGFALFDKDHKLLVWNRRFLEIYPEFDGVVEPGMSYEETARIRLGHGLIAEAIGREEAWLEERLRSFGTSRGPRDVKTPGGRWHEIRERRLPDGCVLLSSIDITDRRDAEQDLADQQALLRALIDNIPEAIFAKDREAKFIVKNRFGAELMGAETVEETVGKSDFDYYADDLASIFYEEDMRVIQEGVTIVGKEQEFTQGRDGRPAWLSSTNAPLRNAEGAIIGLVGCTHDITERKAIENALSRHRDQLEALVAERTEELQHQAERLRQALDKEREFAGLQRQFVSMVSHEFRTPLAIVDGSAHSVLRQSKETLPERAVQRLTKIRRSVTRLTELMESVLAAARLEDGRIKFNPVNCSLQEIIAELFANYGELYPAHKILLDLDNTPEHIFADGKLLRQVFSNLLSNALKYSPDGGNVWIKGYRQEDESVIIEVRDEGVGIPLEEQAKLFERFFRASTSTGIAGTGIGLHLASHLVKMHKGMIDVESVEGHGTTFRVHLPNRPSVANDDHPSAKNTANGLQDHKVLGSDSAAQ